MSNQVANGAMLKCSFGAAPSSLVVLPLAQVIAETGPAATIMDSKPMVNILPFGMCNSPANPMVAAATAAAMGALTPMPCVPVTPAPWLPGKPTVIIGQFPALDNASKCLCNWGGMIAINMAGTTQTQLP
ncbi:DUF4280 domain-containing protein [Chitinimonas arctica]|uniref:DUF4280 domain-containing protein n=1 Tax=Chitinimonas arctica TaxID=2594795 RepID=A0A516SBB1_9NEIS|nr:DUF4280 domain-containing protein [Chitinimonas arctica]QDQ25437.1 DUF4280 domain-containing protein [Chitinimonas arctica]